MLKSKTFVKKTRSGGVLKIVREHYLRDDIWCGSEVCSECKDEAPALQCDPCIESNLCIFPHYLIPDTNVVLHQVRVQTHDPFHPEQKNPHSTDISFKLLSHHEL